MLDSPSGGVESGGEDGLVTRSRNIVVLGFSCVGKTAICQRFAHNRFDESQIYLPTFEGSFSKRLMYQGEHVKLVIKDTQGDDGETIFRNEYGLGYHGYLFVYSISSHRSLDVIRTINEKLLNLTGADELPRVLVGNKADLAEQRQVSSAEAQALADEWGCGFLEVSAKDNTNIDAVFHAVLDEMDIKGPDTGLSFLCCPCDILYTSKDALDTSGVSADGDGTEEQVDSARTAAKVAALLTCAGGAGMFGGGVEVAARGNELLLSYLMVAVGMFTLAVSVLGLIGTARQSQDFLRVHVFGMVFLVVVEVVVFVVALSSVDALRDNMTLLTVISCLFVVLQLLSTYCARRLIHVLDDNETGNSYFSLRNAAANAVDDGSAGGFPI